VTAFLKEVSDLGELAVGHSEQAGGRRPVRVLGEPLDSLVELFERERTHIR
jgi:hypothetical protein